MARKRDREGLSANSGLNEYGGLPVVVLVLARTWAGRPPVFGMVGVVSVTTATR